jgi:biopolymer transport protein ExbB/TolQ
MMRYMLEGGFAMWPILLIAVAIAILVLFNTVRLFGVRKADERTRSSVNAILFWGVVAVVIGLFGQWSGLYKVATFLINAPAVNPGALIMGFSETLISTIAGLTVFTVAAPCWFVLHARCRALGPPGLSESRDEL